MFTGLVQAKGVVSARSDGNERVRLVIRPMKRPQTAQPGDSIAIDGCCLTIADCTAGEDENETLAFDVVQQTLRRTTLGILSPGMIVNLEAAATPSSPLGGHIVQGHIDAVARARRVDAEGEHRIRIEPPPELMDFIIPQGSVAINGVSLTIASVADDSFDVAIIPATLEATNLGRIGADAMPVNIEADYLVKATLHYLNRHAEVAPAAASGSGEEL